MTIGGVGVEGGHEAIAQEEHWDLAGEVEALGSPQHTRRQLARVRLRESAIRAKRSLEAGLASPSLEIRLASRELLDELDAVLLEQGIARLLLGDGVEGESELPGWLIFRKAAGDDLASRKLFAKIVRSDRRALLWLERLAADPVLAAEAEVTGLDTYLPLELGRMASGDAAAWGLLLVAASQPELKSVPVLSSRVRSGLLDVETAQRLNDSPHTSVIRQLVSHWLHESSEAYVNATMLKIALYYRCDETALMMVDHILSTPRSSPAAVATALILLTRLQPSRAERELRGWRGDRRVCHVWQIVAARRRAVQTQVGDVAVALSLYISGHDPREFGFADIEADPALIFREFSMGFEGETLRQDAYQRALNVLEDR